LLTLQNKLKNITIAAIEMFSILTRDAVRAQFPHIQSEIKIFVVEKLDDKLSEEFFNNVSTNEEITDTEITKKEIVEIAQSAVTQQLRRRDARSACEEKNYLESFFFLLLIKIEEFQNKNSTALKIRKQLTSDSTRDVCAKRGWSIHKRVLFFFYAVLVPNKAFLKEKLLRLYYNNSLAGYFGIKKTRTLISRKFYWSRITSDIDKYIRECDICQCNKILRYRLYGELTSLSVSARFWTEISMDFIIELFVSRCGSDIYDAILIVVDRYSKISLYIFAKSVWTAEDLADILFEKILLVYFGIRGIVFDRKSLFISDY